MVDAVPAVFDFTDAYVELYTLDGVTMTTDPTQVIAAGTGVTTLTFASMSVAAATDIADASTYGEKVITFTVTLP